MEQQERARRGGRGTGGPADTEAGYEQWKGKGVALRAFFYIAGTHLFAGFIWLLFTLGEHAQK
ncbi:hypothetical protein HYE82_26815 [Streptomyces sp. BR123]|jgi:hypothetical protein|uniref:DUF6126 family protein n=1 Tax=Streptomyces sp. BR123 TaxID=2749828 RepID=UPI0015C4395B|nr:DUF6126 family protein [Streptomyces sp. BR123]NXY97921.1 hypothetical protein [Streptomyces sp. BR123]